MAPMRDILVEPHLLQLGIGLSHDADVLLGYRPSRRVEDLTLSIGPDATLRSGTIIYAGCTIGADFQSGHHVVVREQNSLGDHVSIWSNTTIDYGCRIGNNVKIHANCYVAQFTVLEDDVFLAPGVTIANDPHPGCAFSGACMRGPTLRHGVQVGVNVTIIPLVTIGEYSVIGAGAVVTRDIPPRSLVIGNPGRVVKPVDALHCTTDVAPTGHAYHPYAEPDEGN